MLENGVQVELRPTVGGESTDTNSLFARSSGRSWLPIDSLERTESALRLPPIKPGKHSVLVAKMDGDRVTHFSKIIDFDAKPDDRNVVDVSLTAVTPIKGMLSDNVPRPVNNGRIDLSTLAPSDSSNNRVGWTTWVPIRADGSFIIEAWPTGEKIQLTALCEGYIAKSGEVPAGFASPGDEQVRRDLRPQVFSSDDLQPIEVDMTPVARCVVNAVDEDERPVAGITIEAWPNVRFWDGGSSIYCDPLVSGERLLKYRSYESSIDQPFAKPFRATTDRFGTATLELPAGNQTIGLLSDVYELPITLGRRYVRTELAADEASEITVQLQPKGSERLGDWDKLAGVVFGCSTREGRRICALPGMSEKMDEFTSLLRDATTHNNPELFAKAYATVGRAFADIGDYDEASKWYLKASQQQKVVRVSD